MLKEQRRKVAVRALSRSSARWRGWPPVGRGGWWRQCEATGRAETLKRRATTGAKRRRAGLQARARAAEAGRVLKCGAEPERGGASGRRDGSMGSGDGQWPCLRLARFRGRATAARAPVGGVSGARIRTRQACARGERLAGVRRPCGSKDLGSAVALTGDVKS